MIVVNKNPNITHLSYAMDKAKGVVSFSPGQNVVATDVWAAVKKQAGKSMAHFGTFLKPIGEDLPEGKEIDITGLNADDAIDLVGGAMDLAALDRYAQAENARKGGARKTVIEAIEKQSAEIRAIEKKKQAAK